MNESKQNKIPTTVFVAPYNKNVQFETWAQSVAGFANGAQSVKKNVNISSIRIGAMVHLEGEIEITQESQSESILPVAPRQDGFINLYDDLGNVTGLRILANTKTVNLSIFEVGTYFISGQYIAEEKKRL